VATRRYYEARESVHRDVFERKGGIDRLARVEPGFTYIETKTRQTGVDVVVAVSTHTRPIEAVCPKTLE
jgi:hypothetical protein